MLKYLLSQTMERNEIQGVHVTMLQPAGEWLGCRRRDENYAYIAMAVTLASDAEMVRDVAKILGGNE